MIPGRIGDAGTGQAAASAYDAQQSVRGDQVTRRPAARPTTCRAESGQVAVEWLMVAGILTAVAIILTGMFQPVLVGVVRMLARSVRTVGL